MATLELKGIHKVTSKGRHYYYAWRGGPRLKGEPGSPEFLASYLEATASRHTPDTSRFRSLVAAYKASNEYQKLADTTKRTWSVWLDRVSDHFGDLRIAQFDRRDKILPVIRAWRDGYAATPRAADTGLQVLSRLLAFAIDPLGKISANPCEGVRHLYKETRPDVIWTDADITQLKSKASAEIGFAVDLAAHTGLRVSDLIKLSWSHVQDDTIIIATSKSRHRKREAIIPVYSRLEELLEGIPRRASTILTSSRHTPWTRDGLGSSFNKAKLAAGLAERDLHFHDLRGTAATKFYIAGLPERVIAEMLGWEEAEVSRIIRRYVDRHAATRAIIEKLDQAIK
jgi:integrase